MISVSNRESGHVLFAVRLRRFVAHCGSIKSDGIFIICVHNRDGKFYAYAVLERRVRRWGEGGDVCIVFV